MHHPHSGIADRLLWLLRLAALPGLLALANVAYGSEGADPPGSPAINPVPLKRGSRMLHRSRSNTTHDTHYLFGTSAIAMESGRGCYQVHDVLLHSASFSPVQGLAIGGGVQVASLVSSLASREREPLLFARASFSGKLGGGAHLGGFALAARTSVSPSARERSTFPVSLGLGGAQLTLGNDRAHATISIGGAMDDRGMKDRPLFGLAGLVHLTDHFCLITEHWQLPFGPDGYRVHGYGVRFTHRAMALDAAFAVNRELADFFFLGVPVLGLSLRL